MKYDYDLFVIGGGSGGIRAARRAAARGAKTALCEADRMGGTCVIRGCIPKKLMVYGASFPEAFKLAESYGYETAPVLTVSVPTAPVAKAPFKLNWRKFNETRAKEIQRLEALYQKLLDESGVRRIKGFGRLKGPHTAEAGGQIFTSRCILIATGGKPSPLPVPGADLTVSSNDMFSLPKPPQSLLVIGAGYIALEFASIFRGLGAKVRVLFRRDYVLRGFDRDIRKALQEELIKKGVGLAPQTLPVKIERAESGLRAHDNRGGVWEGDLILMATGRKANTEGLDLKAAGVQTNEKGEILVNENFETACPGVFAIGDAAATPYQLTPVALREAVVLTENLFGPGGKGFGGGKPGKGELGAGGLGGDKPDGGVSGEGEDGSAAKPRATAPSAQAAASPARASGMSYENIPSAVFTDPPVGSVGLSEGEALKRNLKVTVYESRFRPLKLSLSKKNSKTYMKLVVEKESRRVLGCHIVGEGADEMLQGFAVAVRAGLSKEDFDQTVGIHPTSAEELVTMREARKPD